MEALFFLPRHLVNGLKSSWRKMLTSFSEGCEREWEFEFLWAEAKRVSEWLCWCDSVEEVLSEHAWGWGARLKGAAAVLLSLQASSSVDNGNLNFLIGFPSFHSFWISPGCRLTVYGAAFVSNFHLASRSNHLHQLFSVNSRDQWTKYPAQAPEAPDPDFNTPVLNFCKRRDRMYSCRLPLWVQIKFSWIQYDPGGFHWSMSLRVVHAYFLASTYSPTMPYVSLETRKAFSWGGWGEAMKH